MEWAIIDFLTINQEVMEYATAYTRGNGNVKGLSSTNYILIENLHFIHLKHAIVYFNE